MAPGPKSTPKPNIVRRGGRGPLSTPKTSARSFVGRGAKPAKVVSTPGSSHYIKGSAAKQQIAEIAAESKGPTVSNSVSQLLSSLEASEAGADGLTLQVQAQVRQALIDAAQQRTHRDSPTSPTLNETTIPVSFKLAGKQVMTVLVRADFDANQIFLSPEQRQNYQENVNSPDLTPEARTIIQTLLKLDGKPIIQSTSSPQRPALPTGEPHVDILPEAPAADVVAFKARLDEIVSGIKQETVLGPGILTWELSVEPLRIGTLTLDADGHIIGSNLSKPMMLSPRGTMRRTGIQTRHGTQVPVILYGKQLIFFETHGLNDKQHAVLKAANTRDAVEAKTQNPYLLALTHRRGVGGLFLDVSMALSKSFSAPDQPRTARLALMHDADRGFRFDTILDPNAPAPAEAIAVIDVRLTSHNDTGPFSFMRKTRTLEYEVIAGELPAEVVDGLEYLKERTTRDTLDYLHMYSGE